MMDFGLFQVPGEVINWMAITTACVIALMYIGIEIISAIGGVVVVIFALRSLLYNEPLSVAGFEFGTYACITVLLLGLYLAYQGVRGFLESDPRGRYN